MKTVSKVHVLHADLMPWLLNRMPIKRAKSEEEQQQACLLQGQTAGSISKYTVWPVV